MHLQRPVTQRFHHELQHARMIEIQCVAGSGNVLIKAAVGIQSIIRGIVDAAERQGRAKVIAFAAMIVDNVENDFDPGIVQPLDHSLEAGDRICRQKARIRRKIRDRIVAPIIG